DPYPDAAAIPLVNTATITSLQTAPANASVATYVAAPRPDLLIQKTSNTMTVAPGSQVTYTISYQNSGNAPATNVRITDSIPLGFTYVNATPAPFSAPLVGAGGTVVWDLGTVAAGVTGSTQLRIQATNPFTRATNVDNIATMSSVQTPPIWDTAQIGVVESGQSCRAYYFHDETTNTGFAGIQKAAILDAPVTGQSGAGSLVTAPLGQVYVEAVRFYQDPAPDYDVQFSGPITTYMYIDRVNGPGITVRSTISDYNPINGVTTLIGTNQTSFGGNQKGLLTPFSFNLSGALQKGHRLLWVFEVKSDVSSQTADILLQYGGVVTNSVSGTIPATFADSRSVFCITPPANLTFDKQVNQATAIPGDTLVYTVRFANTGASSASGAVITDTLPTGITYQSASLNGAPAAPSSVVGQQYAFDVRSANAVTPGLVTGGGSGTLVITATVDAPLSEAITSLTNVATLGSNQTLPKQSTAITSVVRPNVTINKAADRTLLIPGDRVTYTLTLLNSGTASAANLVITDVVPATPYFTYVTASASDAGSYNAGTNTLTWLVPTLGAGQSKQLIFQMEVAASGTPDGITTLDNSATVLDPSSGQRNSNTVTVAISTNPNLRLSKRLEPTGSLAAGDLVTYTLVVTNTGSGDALQVLVQDPIPTNTSYVPGTLRLGGAPLTDVADGDAGTFDTFNNRVQFAVGTLPGGASRTLQFTVRIQVPLANGLTPVDNAATAGASNTSTKQATASTAAAAATALTVSKSGPSVVAYPLTSLAASATNTTTLTVESGALIELGQYVLVAGQTRRVTAVDGNVVTVDAPVTAASGASLIGSITYAVNYHNTGTASATGVILTDTLPASSIFITATDNGVHNAGLVTWALGALAPDDGGQVGVTIFPGGTGTLTNTATLASAETAPVTATATTTAGGLRMDKWTTTPEVDQSLAGTTATYVIAAENTLSVAATNVIITDVLSSGFTHNETLAITGGTRIPATLEPTVGGAQPSWGVFTIPANSTLLITFTVSIAPTVGPATYQNEVIATAGNAAVIPFDALNTSAEDVTVRVPIVILDKTVDPSDVQAAEMVTYTITARNTGSAAALGTRLTDTLPAGFTYVSDVTSGEINATRTSTEMPTFGDTEPAWGVWNIAPTGLVTITFKAKAAPTAGVYSNTVTAVPSNTLVPVLTNAAPVTVTGSALADLSLAKGVNNSTPYVGDQVTFTLTARNDGPIAATGVAVSETLPSGYTYVTSDATTGSYDQPGGRWSIGSLDAGTVATLTITATVNASGNYANYAQVAANDQSDPDSTPGDNSVGDDDDATASVTPVPVADLGIIKSSTPSPHVSGAAITYTVVVTNAGPSAVSAITVTDNLPAAILSPSYAPSEGLFDSGTGAWTGIALGAGHRKTLTIPGTLDSAQRGDLSNTATVSSP
ncbi:MAG: DUF11 domain-containing protein, partial [Caldilineaceae bacterium]|nr:DUF11 domain-containing protein [Caldilineaceae bacterium]